MKLLRNATVRTIRLPSGHEIMPFGEIEAATAYGGPDNGPFLAGQIAAGRLVVAERAEDAPSEGVDSGEADTPASQPENGADEGL